MSHISTYATGIKIKNVDWIKKAIGLMAPKFNGIRFVQVNENTIMVRYAPIEGYQRDGNMRLVRNHLGVWEMKYDTWHCESEVKHVHEAFEIAYQQAGVSAFYAQFGYSQASQMVGQDLVMVGRKW